MYVGCVCSNLVVQYVVALVFVFFFKQKTAYEMRISDWSSDVCSSDLHWIVVEGTAKVTVGDEVTLLTENQSLYVPAGAKHRVENPGRIPVVFIEVQTGTSLAEDDIVRSEERYTRIG